MNALGLVEVGTVEEVRRRLFRRDVVVRRRLVDFSVDGVPLHRLVDEVPEGRAPGVVPPLDADDLWREQFVRRLLGDLPPSARGGRVELAMCVVCGDLGCGSLTARLEVGADVVRWSELGWQTDQYDDEEEVEVLGRREPLPVATVSRLAFDRRRYEELLVGLLPGPRDEGTGRRSSSPG